MNKDEMTMESIIFGLKCELAEKDKEIERFNAKYRNLEINYNAVWEDFRKYEVENEKLLKDYYSERQTCDEQKAEIERLTELAELRKRDNEETCKLLFEAEKQVDELTRKAVFYYKRCKSYGIECFCDEELERCGVEVERWNTRD